MSLEREKGEDAMRTGVITLTVATALALAFLLVAGFPPSSEAGACPDADGDSFCDLGDNCLVLANASQTDSNGDGFGNRCDPDLDNSGAVGNADLGLLKQSFGLVLGQPGYNPDADLDEPPNNAVGNSDLGILKQFFGLPPGP
jgi:hypothetical protein